MRALLKFRWLVSAILLGLTAVPQARADTVLLGETELVTGTESFVFPFIAPGAGTVEVTLSSLLWPEQLASMSFAATSASTVLSSFTTGSSDPIAFSIGAGGTYYAHLTGTAQGPLDLGLYSLRVTFEPNVVALPESASLLVGGMAMLIGLLGALRGATPPRSDDPQGVEGWPESRRIRRRHESVTSGA